MDILTDELLTARDSLLTGRTISDYYRDLDFTPDQLAKWGVVIDLGSGLQQEFARGVKELGLSTTVISIDPRIRFSEEIDVERDLSDEEIEKRRDSRKNPQEKTLSALAQHLPLGSGSVDEILASRSVPLYIYDQKNMDLVINEMSRVLKVGGEIRMYPVSEYKARMVENAIEKNHALSTVRRNSTGTYGNELFVIQKIPQPELT